MDITYKTIIADLRREIERARGVGCAHARAVADHFAELLDNFEADPFDELERSPPSTQEFIHLVGCWANEVEGWLEALRKVAFSSSRYQQFAEQVARMTRDGEEGHTPSVDDLYDTVHSLIAEARELTGIDPVEEARAQENERRARQGGAILELPPYQETEPDSRLDHALLDLMHWARAVHGDASTAEFNSALEQARAFYAEDVEG